MRKLKRLAFISLLYFVVCLCSGIFFSLTTIHALRSHATASAKTYVILARASIFPFRILSQPLSSHFFSAWDEGLKTAALIPNFFDSAQVLEKTYFDQTPLQTKSLRNFSQTYTQLISQALLFQTEVEKSRLLSAFVSTNSLRDTFSYVRQHENIIRQSTALIEELVNEVEVKQKYTLLILFENNMELRPTGGFPGSYAQLNIEIGKPITLMIEDIYVPDGQLTGHVDPPLPIQEAFQQGFWKLRDANWHPDFSESSTRVQWFFAQATDTHFDAMAAITFSSIQQLLDITGDIWVPDFNTTVTTHNIYPLLQRADDAQFFPGSTKKKDTLKAFTAQLLLRLPESVARDPQKFVNYILTQLNEKNVLLTMNNQKLQQYIDSFNWSGKLSAPLCTSVGCEHDYFSIFDANLGVNKANCCVKRSIDIHKSSGQNGDVQSQFSITYNNAETKAEYEGVSGDYKAFVRLYFPAQTQVKQLIINHQNYTDYVIENKRLHYFHPITAQGYSLQEVAGLTELGIWIIVPKGQSTQINFETTSKLVTHTTYRLVVQKQPGTFDFFNDFAIYLGDKKLLTGNIQKDVLLQ